jgi:hypothetical protein
LSSFERPVLAAILAISSIHPRSRLSALGGLSGRLGSNLPFQSLGSVYPASHMFRLVQVEKGTDRHRTHVPVKLVVESFLGCADEEWIDHHTQRKQVLSSSRCNIKQCKRNKHAAQKYHISRPGGTTSIYPIRCRRRDLGRDPIRVVVVRDQEDSLVSRELGTTATTFSSASVVAWKSVALTHP